VGPAGARGEEGEAGRRGARGGEGQALHGGNPSAQDGLSLSVRVPRLTGARVYARRRGEGFPVLLRRRDINSRERKRMTTKPRPRPEQTPAFIHTIPPC
jgi:hypothetical protein